MNPPRIIAYPRSGTHYLQNLIFAYSSKKITFSHYPVNEDSFIITIVRDPFDSLQSHVAMSKHYNPEKYTENDYTEYYVGLYEYLDRKANLIIYYNDLINFPEATTKMICDLLGFKKNISDYNVLVDNKDIKYLVSSKTVKEYNEEYFKIEDMAKCYSEYHKLLSKANRIGAS
jgi:hypothetical protein